jgi:DNA-binding response OmpR family regulator
MGRALIVSAGASSNEYISARLAELGYTRPTIIPSGAEARRRMLESDFELIVVNAPLPDEFGHELCSSAVEKTDAGVVLLAKAAAAEQLLAPMSEQGVLLLSKPFSNTLFLQAIHLAAACSCSGRKTPGCRKRSHRYGWSAMQNAVWWSGSR